MIPVEFPPGVTTLASKNAKISNWRECHLIRWDNGTTLRPVGGWEKLSIGPFASRLRKMHRWVSNNNIILNAYLCEQHCYIESSGVLTDITPVGGMVPIPTNRGGYGDLKYGDNFYGTPRAGQSKKLLTTSMFSLDNWGEELRVMTSADGRYLAWKPSTPATPLVAVVGAPTGNRSFVITPERHAMLFAMNDFGKFGWSNEQDDTNWAFTDITSRAGFYDVSPRSPILTQQLFAGGILMFTTVMSYVIEWTGLPYIYSYHPVGKVSIPYSPSSICETPKGVVWPSFDGWWIFDGTAPRVIPCAIWDRIQDTIDVTLTRSNGVCVHFANKGEVWWFYVDKNSPDTYTNRYAVYDYRSDVWAMGNLSRTCGYVYANDPYPIMSDGVSVWKHESGFQYPGANFPWIESQNLSPNGGENWLTFSKLMPDVAGDIDALRFSVVKTNSRAGYTPEVYTTQRKKQPTGYVDIRETARDMRLRIDMVKNSDWSTVGPILLDIRARGKK
jgi:hypothetical protein